jgi:sodium pump decarboxylase gamma subunit
MDLLVQATTIMILGMAVTFAFLGVVIAGINLTARIIHKIEGAPVEEGGDEPPPAQDRRKVVAAIAAAVLRHPGNKT